MIAAHQQRRVAVFGGVHGVAVAVALVRAIEASSFAAMAVGRAAVALIAAAAVALLPVGEMRMSRAAAARGPELSARRLSPAGALRRSDVAAKAGDTERPIAGVMR